MEAPAIPARTSSKRQLELDAEIKVARKEIKRLRRSLSSLNRRADPISWYSTQLEICESQKDEHYLGVEKRKEELRAANAPEASDEWRDLVLEDMKITQEFARKILEYTSRVSEAEEEEKRRLRARRTRYTAESADIVAELLMELWNRPGEKGRSSSDQSVLRNDAISEYNSRDLTGERLWCPITHAYLPQKEICAAHLFPHRMGRGVMKMAFGSDVADELNSPRNCLLMAKTLEEKFDKNVLVIVPLKDEATVDQPTRWQVRVIHNGQDEQQVKGTPFTLGDLDGRELRFCSEYRPRARYLYFHYTMSLLFARAQKRRFPKTTEREVIWAMPDRYLLNSMLDALAFQVGHDLNPIDLAMETLEEAEGSAADTFSGGSNITSTSGAKEVVLGLCRKLAKKKSKKEKKDEPTSS